VSSVVSSTANSSQFKVVASKRDSLLPNSGHPDGWVNRAAEKEQLAGQGDEWRSDAYVLSFSVFYFLDAHNYHRFDIQLPKTTPVSQPVTTTV
jgi:hypothetical protein